MPKKRVYISILFALVVFVSSGIIIYGQNNGGKGYTRIVDSGKEKTGYVKADEQTTGATNADPAKEGTADKAEKLLQSAIEDGKANKKTGTENMDSDYLKEVPKDYNIDMPAPTQQEAAQNIANAISVNPGVSSVGLRLLAASYHYLGVPYKLGGDGVRTTDCSMFTRMSAVRSGLEPSSFRRGAGIQYGYSLHKQFNMQLISKGASLQGLQPGDFVFFNWRNEFSRVRPYGIGHVGLYIGPTKGSAIYTIEAGNPVHKGWRNTKYLVGFGRIVK